MTNPKEILKTLRTVRTSDISDALDSMGCQQQYVMDPVMRPLYFGVRFAGIARTSEYDLRDRPVEAMSYAEFDERQYKEDDDGLWQDPGLMGGEDEVLVIDAKRTQAGILGSANTLAYRIMGVAGFIIDGTVRDSYECILQKTPACCTVRSPQHPMGRIRPVTHDQPITCAGVVVRPGDFIIADDDGVAVVPQTIAAETVHRAKLIQDKDRPARRDAYEKLGLPLDETVQ